MKQKFITLLLLFLLIATAARFRKEMTAKLERLATVKEHFWNNAYFIDGSGFHLNVSLFGMGLIRKN